jgi:hypothetical protein
VDDEQQNNNEHELQNNDENERTNERKNELAPETGPQLSKPDNEPNKIDGDENKNNDTTTHDNKNEQDTKNMPIFLDEEARDADVIHTEMETKYGARHERHNLRPWKPQDYGHLHRTLESIVMTQH